jgi:hypothetical protein
LFQNHLLCNERKFFTPLAGGGGLPPYVLVAESSTALDAHVYADSYPKDVAGLVFVNGVRPDILIQIGVAGKLPRT